ncbi:hypothetical protein AB0F73_02235 [Micromonospora purpureochromogenes]|uniref:hypothetical protein n=1 Tax=Micromonospora purpureochromogenes TaxID=47872 RepID=UPI0033C82F67
MRTRHPIVAIVAATALTLTGCGRTDSPDTPAPAGSSAPPSAKPPAPAAPLDAKAVLAKLTAAKVGVTKGAVQNEDTDPNNLLGRPNGYTSRASADLPGGDTQADKGSVDRGLAIEVFPTVKDADRRAAYIKQLQQGAPILGTEYHYRADGGRVLVRVSGKVKPSQAKKVEQVLTAM